MEKEIELLKAEESELREKLKQNTQKQRDINQALFFEKYGIGFGDTVEFIDGRKICQGVLDEIKFSHGNTVSSIWVKLFKKDGTVGERKMSKYIYSDTQIRIIKKAEK